MNVTKCLNGHFYDADKYEICPHCGAISINGGPQTKKPHSLFDEGKNSPEVEIRPMPENVSDTDPTFGAFTKNKSGQPAGGQNETPAQEPGYGAEIPASTPAPGPAHTPHDGPVFIFRDEETPAFVDLPESPEPAPEEPTAGDSLRQEVEKAADSSDEKTIGFFSPGREKSVPREPAEPVVGWLVCVKGVHFGKAFPIYVGRNAVGRNDDNKIVLSEDNTVSREKHAWIIYEPKKREFFVQQGEGRGLTYLNDDTVLESKKLAAKDRLNFGDGTYLLIPLCGEDFTWEDYMEKE